MFDIKKLPWRIENGRMRAAPFVFGDIKPQYPFYELKPKIEGDYEVFQPAFYYTSDGCCVLGKTLIGDFVDMEPAKAVCQLHFDNWVRNLISEV